MRPPRIRNSPDGWFSLKYIAYANRNRRITVTVLHGEFYVDEWATPGHGLRYCRGRFQTVEQALARAHQIAAARAD